MSTVRFTAEVLPVGTIRPPRDIQLPPGKAEVTVDTPQHIETKRCMRDFAGAIRSEDSRADDNDRIDADLAREYGDSHLEAS